MERPDHVLDVARPDPDLGLVVTLVDRHRQLGRSRTGPQPSLESGVHQTSVGTVGPIARSGQWPRRSLTSCWSFIIP